MTWTVADIQRWDADDVREVAVAANGRAQSMFDVADGLARVLAFPAWDGNAAAAAKETAGRLRKDLQAHGREALTVADAARSAADNIDRIHSSLATLKADAQMSGLDVDPATSRIVQIPGAGHGRREMRAVVASLQTRLDVLVSEATLVDIALANAITVAATTIPITDSPPVGGGGHWATGDMSSGDIGTIDQSNRQRLQELSDEYARLPDSQAKTDRLGDLAAIREALTVADSHLIYLEKPADPSQMIAAATSVGDPFTADHVSVTVPGVHGATRHSIAGMTRDAEQLRREAQDIARQVGQSHQVATVAWAGYQPPPDIASLDTVGDDLARAGAPKLTMFLRNLDTASRNPGHTTALFGHSYGSLLSGIALRGGASSLVDNAVFYGSPEFEATSTAQLGMTDTTFFVMSAPADPINHIGALAPLHGWGSDPNEVIPFDTTPGSPGRYRFPHLETEAGSTPISGYESKIGASGHSQYGRQAGERMTGYNLATVLLNRADLAVSKTPAP